MKTILYIFSIVTLTFLSILAQEQKSCSSVECHQELISPKVIHPAAEDDCTNCHESETDEHPSESGNDFSLADESPELCLICHDDKEPDESHTSIHPPFEEDCLNCHNPHASDNKFVLEESVPDLCFSCHDDPADTENIIKIHGAVLIENKCINCHSPHSSENRKLLKQDDPDLCLSCHKKEIVCEDRYIPSIASKIANEELAHPPVVDDGCLTCHQPHASQYKFLLDDTFPKGNYASGFEGSYSLCFTCHDETAFTAELTNEDTEFRNGSTNLHFVHVNKDKSRSCTNCHDVHGSNNEYLIIEEMSFGKIKMKLNFRVTETGGSCFPGCHEEKKYNR